MLQNLPSAEPSTGRTDTILLVDDDPDILAILRRLMQGINSGYDVVTVHDGAEALAQITQRAVRLLITDYSMPTMTGLELTKAVKQISPDNWDSFGITLIVRYVDADQDTELLEALAENARQRAEFDQLRAEHETRQHQGVRRASSTKRF